MKEQGDNYLEMLQGTKSEQRRWRLYNRFKYFDSKYLAGESKSDVFQFRAYAKDDVKIIPLPNSHAKGSLALQVNNYLFVGDSLAPCYKNNKCLLMKKEYELLTHKINYEILSYSIAK